MSLTILALIAAPVFAGAAVGIAFASDETKYKRAGWIASAVLAGIAVASLALSGVSLMQNKAESERACIDKGGIIYEASGTKKCIDDIPRIIHKL